MILSFQRQDPAKRRSVSPRNSEKKENGAYPLSPNMSDVDYTPPSVLQQQVSTLEQLMERGSWLDLIPSDPELPQAHPDDDNESVGSARSLKKELDGASGLLPDMERELAQLELEVGLLTREATQYDNDMSEQSHSKHRNHPRARCGTSEILDSLPPSDHSSTAKSLFLFRRTTTKSAMPDIDRTATAEAAETVQLHITSSNGNKEESSASEYGTEVEEEDEKDAMASGILRLLTGNKKVSKMLRRKNGKTTATVPVTASEGLSNPRASDEQITEEAVDATPKVGSKRGQVRGALTVGFDGQVQPLDDSINKKYTLSDNNEWSLGMDQLTLTLTEEQQATAAEKELPEEHSKKWQRPKCMLFASSAIMVASLIFGEPKSNALNLVSFRYC